MALQTLVGRVLQPLRDHFDRPIIVSSGYRSPALNEAVNGSETSQHMRGEAADFEIPGVANFEVARVIDTRFVFDQLILEFYTPGQPHSGWVHVSYSAADSRRQALTYNGRDYIRGLHR